MLCELRVENLLLIERAELRLGSGLNVLTGETGAGKTVLAHALDLLLGGRARSQIVRPGAAEAYVEGVFSLSDELRETLGERISPDAEELVLARRVSAEGRTRAYLGGRSATAADLRDIGAVVLSFYGQHDHRKLTLAGSQLDILDGFCGSPQSERRAAFAAAWTAERHLRARQEELRERAGARERELDLLVWELAEIEQVEPSEEVEAELQAERERLRHLESLQAAAAAGLAALVPDEGSGGGAENLAAAARALDGVRGIDSDLDGCTDRLHALAVETADVAAELRGYSERLALPSSDGDEAGWGGVQARLDAVEERLATFERLKRKHGGTITAVLAHAEDCQRRHAELTGADAALSELDGELAASAARLQALAAELTAAREEAAGRLAVDVRTRLSHLAMDGATFEASLRPRDGYGPSGGDEVEFLIAPNPGVPPAPLREIASGGELSRVMLALMSATAQQGGPGTLVFDEIDAGIGGQTARAVGEQLRVLSQERQLICITHLPQIASLAQRHFTIVKESSAGTARTTVTQVEGGDLVGELVRMLGADDSDSAARRHAEELLQAA